MDANLLQWCQQNEYGNGQWKGYSTGWVQYNTTPVHGYEGLDFEKLADIAPGSPLPISATSVSTTVTPVTTTGGSRPRRLLSDDERRRMCEYHESHPGVKQTEIGAMFGVERSTVSKVLRNKEQLLYSNDGSQRPAKKAKTKGKPLDNSKIRKQAQHLTVTVGNSESRSKLANSAQLEKFQQKNNLLDAKPEKGPNFFHEPNGIHAVDSSTASLSKTLNNCSPVLSDSSTMVSSPTFPLLRLENTSPVNSVGSPTQGDASRALGLVWSFFQNQPAGILEPGECATIGKLMAKLKLSHAPNGTPVLPGGHIPVDRPLSPRVSKKRTIDGIYSHGQVAV